MPARRCRSLVAPVCFTLCALLGVSLGCQTPVHPDSIRHIVMADAAGGPVQPGSQRTLSHGEFQAHIQTIIGGAEAYFDSREREASPRRLLLFIHGGLNSPNSTVERANDRRQQLQADGFYPVFLGWHSSLASSYVEHLLEARRGRTWQTGGVLSAPLFLLADLGRSLTRAPIVWLHELSSTLESFSGTAWKPGLFVTTRNTEAHFERLQQRLHADDPAAPAPLRVSQGADHGPRSWELAGTVRSFTYLVTLPFKLTLAPIVDAFGKQSWKIMLRRTDLLRRRQLEYELREREEAVGVPGTNALDLPRTGAFAVFAEGLIEFLQAHPEVEVTIIAHSMGTIISDWLVATYGDALRPRDIVYLAAAASIRDVERDVIPYLESHPDARFFNLTLHPRAEVRETWSAGIGSLGLDPAPRGSLLVWIDNYFSDPTSFADRTIGRWDNLIPATHVFPRDVRDRVFIKAFGVTRWGGSDPDNPQTHGDLTKGKFWDEAFWQPEVRTAAAPQIRASQPMAVPC